MTESLQGFVDGEEAPDERKVVGVLGGALVDLARIFGARGDGKAPPLKRASIDGDRGGPREPRETKEARAFRADFEVAMSRLRTHLRWQEWTVRALLVGVGAGIGWAAGLAVSRIFSVDDPVGGPGPAERNRPLDLRGPGPDRQTDELRRAHKELAGSVKFFDPARGFGFVVPDEGEREVFVHSSVLFRSGMTDLEPGQRVFVRVESVPRGLQATQIEPL